MDLSFLNDYLVVVVVGICLCVGYIIKTSITQIPNKYIPLVMGIIGVGLNVWMNMSFTPQVLLGGLFSGLASTGLHQLFVQLINKETKQVVAMDADVIVAIISGLCVAIPSVIATISSNQKSQALINYNIEELDKKVEKHNTVIERTYALEDEVHIIQEKMKMYHEDQRL